MSEIKPNNPEEEKPIDQLDVILLQISWLEDELTYAQIKMEDEIANSGGSSTTHQTRSERFTKEKIFTTKNVIMGHISRFLRAIDNIINARNKEEQKIYKLQAVQQLGKIANVFADSALWLKKQTLEAGVTSEQNDTPMQDDSTKYTILEELFQNYINSINGSNETTNESLDIKANLPKIEKICDEMLSVYNNNNEDNNIEGAYKQASLGFNLALKIWAQYIQDIKATKLPKPGLPSGTIEAWEVTK